MRLAHDQAVGIREHPEHRGVLDAERRRDQFTVFFPYGGADIILAPVIGRHGCASLCGTYVLTEIATAQPRQQRFEEKWRADQAGNRIARQTEAADFPHSPEHQRLARTHGDFPEVKRHALSGQYVMNEVVVAYRGASKRHNDVGAGIHRLVDKRGDSISPVSGNSQVERTGVYRMRCRRNAKGVRSYDLVRPGRAARQNKFVAGCNDGNQGPPHNGNGWVIGAGDQRKRGRIEHSTPVEEPVAGPEVEAGAADMPAVLYLFKYLDLAFPQVPDIFLNDNCVGACG